MCREPVVGHGWPMGVYLGSSYGFAALCHAMVNDPSKGPLILHGYGVGCTATPTPTTGAWGVVGMGAWRWEMVKIHWNGDTVSAALYRGKVPQLQSRKEVLVVGYSQVRSLASPLPAYVIITGRLVLTLAHCLHRLGTLVLRGDPDAWVIIFGFRQAKGSQPATLLTGLGFAVAIYFIVSVCLLFISLLHFVPLLLRTEYSTSITKPPPPGIKYGYLFAPASPSLQDAKTPVSPTLDWLQYPADEPP
ncbi:uncharacterized protein CLUP02_13643 [Colletotrichum lupini]|uniref:Uncharacterized protein n=1 Tax=Colletotrichum lupini TaxID=145971 RepID=A0A9Q8T4P2_9PEZI|nr:uncharacterized protein CLUP02_13643 [Colletotrichum lupini]UQC88121.1 hypothetical protein CLUP02_13643 [Colletotrichum lupini]